MTRSEKADMFSGLNYTVSLRPTFSNAAVAMARFPAWVQPGDAFNHVMKEWEGSADAGPVQVTFTMPEVLPHV